MRKKLAAAAVLTLGASALLALDAWTDPQKPYPHLKHVEAGVECASCHPAAQSDNLKASLLPALDACKQCHDEQDLAKMGVTAIPPRASGFRTFSHRAHLSQGLDCETCHGALVHPDQAAQGKGVLGHALCMECHDGVKQTGECEDCHTNLREGRLDGMVRDPSIMKPADHHPGFIHDHPFNVRLNGTGCRECHRQEDFCSTCHQGENVEFMTHERNWIQTHPLAARKNLNDCTACHELDTFCSDCHAERGIQPGSHAAQGWISSLHAQAARRDIEYCASCHDAEGAFVCANCHKDTGGRGDQPDKNIHPSDFRDSAGHGPWHDDESAACFLCHNAGARQAGVGFCGYCHGAK